MDEIIRPDRLMMLAAFTAYLILLFGVGIFSAVFFSSSMTDFFLGGRKMKDYVVALSAVVSGRSAWLIVGMSGTAYALGLSAVWAVAGYIVVELFLFLFLGKRLRRYTHMKGAITVPDFLEARFQDRTHLLRLVSVIIIVIFMVTYISAQLLAGGKTFHASFHIPEIHGVFITAGIILIYTVLGGFVAVSLMDVIHACFMILGLVVLPAVAIYDFGGIEKMLVALHGHKASLVDPWALGMGGMISFLGIGFGSPGNPHILVRYMSVERPELLRKSALVGTIWNVLMAWGAVFIGLVGRAYFPMEGMLPGGDKETIFPLLAARHLHPLLTGFVMATIFAAIVSTVDSQLLVAGSAVSRDIYQKVLRGKKNPKEWRIVLFSRFVITVMLGVAVAMGLATREMVFWKVLVAWSGLGASFGPPVVLGLFWKRTTRWGALAGLLSGTVVTIAWKLTPALQKAVIKYELVPAFLVSFFLVVVVSLLSKPPEGAEEELKAISARYRFSREA
jgi:sodium/proline symporter